MTAPTYVPMEKVLAGWITANIPGARGVTELPANLADVVPIVEVTRIGGFDRRMSLDSSAVDIDCYHTSRDAARALSLQVQKALRYTLPGQVITGGVVTRVDTVNAPSWRPYDNPALRRFGATYQLLIHTN